MNWTSILTVFVISGSFSGLILTIALKVISNKYRKRLPECTSLFEKIQNEISEMKKASTDRQSMVAALKAAMDMGLDNYKALREDFKEATRELNKIAVNVAELKQNIISMVDSIEAIKDRGER